MFLRNGEKSGRNAVQEKTGEPATEGIAEKSQTAQK